MLQSTDPERLSNKEDSREDPWISREGEIEISQVECVGGRMETRESGVRSRGKEYWQRLQKCEDICVVK